MSKTKVWIDPKGGEQVLRKSANDLMMASATKIKDRAIQLAAQQGYTVNYTIDLKQGKSRAVVQINAADAKSARIEKANGFLNKARPAGKI